MMSKADLGFLYPKNVRFECMRCILCCGDTETRVRHILILEREAQRISEKTLKTVDDFAHRINGNAPYVYEMKKTAAGKCLFLEKDLCAIYPWRPLICRYYPFQLEMLKSGVYGFSFSSECPGVGKGKRLRKDHFEKLFREARRRIGQRRLNRNQTN
jgi:Fe-S-cluster containining protein